MTQALAKLQSDLYRLGSWLVGLSPRVFLLTFTLLAITKIAFIWRLPNVHGAAPAFPSPRENSDLFLGILTYQVTGGNQVGYLLVGLLALVLSVLVIWLSGERATALSATGRTRFILAVSWPLFITQFTWFGHGVEFLPLGIALAVLARSRILQLLGVVIAAFAHPTQAFAAFFTLLVLTFAPEFKRYRPIASIATVVGAIVTIGFSVWIQTAGIPSRIPLAVEVLPQSILNALRHGILGLYSGWAVWWFVVLLAFVLVRGRSKIIVVITAVIFPSIATMIAWDGTRDFVAVAGAVGLALMAFVLNSSATQDEGATNEAARAPGNFALALTAIVFVVLPNVQIMMIGDGIPEPGWMWVGLFENYVLN